jgi:hypothetical protein
MQFRLSLHEVISKSTQALRALNFPPGLDIENGKNIGWLESRGLPGLQILFEEIKAPSHTPGHNPIKINTIENIVQFSGGNQSAFYLAQSAVDFAENGKSVSIKNCRFPLLIFAEMARRNHLPFGFKVQWIEEEKINRGSSISGNSEITINSKSLTTAYNLKITAVKDLIIKNPLKILDRENASKEVGISFYPDHWETICAAAKKVLVPDSEQSHSSAGAEVDDSS